MSMNREQLVALSETYLGLKPTGNIGITQNTAESLVRFLEQAQSKYPALAAKHPFSPHVFDDRAIKFLGQVMVDRQAAAGLNKYSLEDIAFGAWSQKQKGQASSPAGEEIGKLGAMYSLIDYIKNGKLPENVQSVGPGFKAPWLSPTAGTDSLFFNIAVYNELGIDLKPHDRIPVTGGRTTVSHKALFHPDNANSTQQKLIEEAARIVKAMPVNPEARYPEGFRYSEETVAQIAKEILALQAKAICNIRDEKDITKAIMSFQYMPHLADMKLAEQGFGKPTNPDGTPKWDAARVQELNRIGIPRNGGLPDDIYRIPEITTYQSQKWAERFGKIDPADALEIARLKARANDPSNLVYDGNGTMQTAREWIAETHQSPHSFYGLPYHTNKSQYYDAIRENMYLPRLGWNLYKGLDLCPSGGMRPPAGPSQQDSGRSSGAAPIIRTPAAVTPPPSTTICAANAFGNCGNAQQIIIDNSIGATGQTGTKPPCPANSGDCRKPGASAAPPPVQ